MSQDIAEQVEQLTEQASEEAAEIKEDALESAAETHHAAVEAVEQAAEAVEELTDEAKKEKEHLDWKLTTQNTLAELSSKLDNLATLPEQLANHRAEVTAQLGQILQTVQPSPEVADVQPEAVSEEPAAPEEVAEEQKPAPKRKAQFL